MKLRKVVTPTYPLVINILLCFLNITNNVEALDSDTECSKKSPYGDCPTTPVPDMIKNAGYKPRIYHFMTKDGYNLTEIRISEGRLKEDKKDNISSSIDQNSTSNIKEDSKNCSKPAVLLVHGLMADSSIWITHDVDKALAYILADNGYDVWLHNSRGTKYSQNHKTLTKKQPEFWNYSYIEMGKFDIPAALDGIIKTTGCKKIIYIGHSLGTAQFFSGMSQDPKQNKKIKAMFALAPIAYLKHLKSAIAIAAAPFGTILEMETGLFGHFQFGDDSSKSNKIRELMCSRSFLQRLICQNLMFLFNGFDEKQVYEPWYSTMVGHLPASTSSKTMIHMAQGVLSGKFALYDHRAENYEYYKQSSPPDINLKNVNSPVHLFNSENDYLSVVDDVNRLRDELPNVKSNYTIPYKKWNHMDFLMAKDINKYLHIPLLKQLKEYK